MYVFNVQWTGDRIIIRWVHARDGKPANITFVHAVNMSSDMTSAWPGQ